MGVFPIHRALERAARLCAAVCAGGVLCVAGAQAVQQQVWTTESGLPQNSIHDLLQSRDGFLWIATEGGVARFDGASFAVESRTSSTAFTSNDVCCITEANGSLWFGTDDGLVQQTGDKLRRWSEADGLPSAQVLATAAAADGSVLALTGAGVAKIANGRAIVLPGTLGATAMGPGAGSSVLVAAGGVLYHVVNGAFGKLRDGIPANVLGVAGTEDGTVWLRTPDAFTALLPGGQIRAWRLAGASNATQACQLSGTRTEFLKLAGDAVWAGTNRGLFVLHANSPGAEPVSAMTGVSVLSAMRDREGDVWVGTETSGLAELRRAAVSTFPGLADEVVTSVVQAANGSVWIGTRDDGLRTVTSGRVSQHANGKLTSAAVFSLATGQDGSLWAGTPDGLNRVSADGVRHITSASGLPDDFVRSLLVARDGSVWAGTSQGLAHIVRTPSGEERVTQVLTAADGLPADLIGAMMETHSGELWVGTSKGVARISGGHVQSIHATSEAVTALLEDASGKVWIGTRSGRLLQWADGHATTLGLRPVRGGISAMLDDGIGDLWLRSGNGVERMPIASLNECAGATATTDGAAACSFPMRWYGVADGMPSVELPSEGHPAAWRMRDGTLWFATRKGVGVLSPQTLPKGGLQPVPVVIEGVMVDDRSQPATSELRLPFGHSRIQLSFAGLSFAAPGAVRYRYRMQGFDTGWTDGGTHRDAFYTGLPPGRYRFEVTAINRDGVESTHPASIAVVITPPFYRRWWFYAATIGLLGAAVYALYRLRLRRIEREFNAVLAERSRIAREIHDTLAQDFVAVSLQLEVTAQLLKAHKTDAARQQIDGTRTLVQEGIRNARESIWALRNSAESLPARMTEMVKRADGGGAHISFAVGGAYRRLRSETENEAVQIAREALGNAVRHAGATEIQVTLDYTRTAVELQVRDNGRGFDQETAAKLDGHYGLRGMLERAARIPATLNVNSATGEGTLLTLHITERNAG